MIPPEAFAPLLQELQRLPIRNNSYRKTSGEGRSQAFGVVNKRCRAPDYSRQCWRRPYLYKLLLDFGASYVTDISWNAITVNQNYSAAPHRDRGNIGPSYLVAFGEYEGGALLFHEGDLSGPHDVRHAPLITDFAATLHSVAPWTGNRCSLVFYTAANTPPTLPPPSVLLKEGRWTFKRGEEFITDGLPHPLKGKKH
jgi:hypothetical protein